MPARRIIAEQKTYSPKPVDKDVMTLALERVAHIYELYDHVAVGFSGGKDSTVLLNVTLQVAERLDRLPLRVIFVDEEAIPYETERYMRRVIAREGDRINLEWQAIAFRANNACSAEHPYWWHWAPESEHLWCRPMPPEAITTVPGFPQRQEDRPGHYQANALMFPTRLGRSCFLMGQRAQESMRRQQAVTRRTKENYITAGGGGEPSKGYPIYDWRTEDVWHAPAVYGWDHNEAYDIMGMAGIAPLAQRLGAPYGNEPLQKLWMFASCFPDVWEKMIDRVPGSRAAARYARSELYGFQGMPVKPDDQTWEQFVRSFVLTHEPALQAQIAKQIQTHIKGHFNKTTDPLLPGLPHPDTGLSWGFLVRLAMRGDRMDRQNPLSKATPYSRPDDYHRHRMKYEAERARIEGREARDTTGTDLRLGNRQAGE